MSRIKAKLFDIVRLKDGREGTIVEVYDEPPGFEVEISGAVPDLVTVKYDEVVEVIWAAP
ncbi:hypothetical protein RW092_18065 [Paenibacillus sp. 3LSP]|uniref:hypothetical protein n=1 Tax=Paenibacillus sp. 3LSP TaxID=2800795 RepID=UPI0028FD1A55|nr:hypothetical protein [Paenibacillus sp. 3LSP]MDU0332085.1 hypothetical protein [Paenibacillus sp. 3LSP]